MEFIRKVRTGIRMLRADRSAIYQHIGLGRSSDSNKFLFLFDYAVNRYWQKSGLGELFEAEEKSKAFAEYKLFVSSHKKLDVVNLHKTITKNRFKTVVEFGCGISTIAMAHALCMNHNRFNLQGKVHAVEAQGKWADVVRRKLNEINLGDYVDIITATPRLRELRGQLCHMFDELPDVRPDLIYLDGPDPEQVGGRINGLSMKGIEFVTAADPLFYEYGFYPGFQMIVDGRYNNVQFLKNNLRRQYRIKRDFINNITTFFLIR